MTAFVFPCDPLAPRRPDPHFAPEHAAAREAGLTVGLMDHDALTAGRPEEAVRPVRELGDDVVYRGWMVTAGQYEQFHDGCAARGTTLRTDGPGYRSAHELPGWIGLADGLTAETVWAAGGLETVPELCRRLGSGPAVIRDFVKSAKHHWDEAVHLPDVSDAAHVDRVCRRFLELREEAFTGGFVLRRFERYTGSEVRTWWVDGRCVLTGAHPDTPNDLPPAGFAAPDGLADAIGRLGNRFVTADLALREDGVWRLIEIGDGQVSDRPASIDPAVFVAAL